MVGACHDLSFIFNGTGANSELIKISEDIDKEKDTLAGLNDKYNVISKDLYFCQYAENKLNDSSSYGVPEDLKEEKERLISYLGRISDDMEMSKSVLKVTGLLWKESRHIMVKQQTIFCCIKNKREYRQTGFLI